MPCQPENRFDKCIEDGYAALAWTHKHASELNGDPSSISISGISAGGHLAAVVQHLARDAGIPLKMACLTVPTTDYTTYWPVPEGYTLSPSVTTLANAALLNEERFQFFQTHVHKQADWDYLKQVPLSWRAPLHSDNFKGLCDTFIATAECDPLVDEGEAYGRKILNAGGLVMFKRYIGMPHPFMHMPLKAAHEYDRDIVKALKMGHGI